MKRIIFLSCALFASVCAMAQLRVNSNGKVGIGSLPYNGYKTTILSDSTSGVYVSSTGIAPINSSWRIGLNVKNGMISGKTNIGLMGCVYGPTDADISDWESGANYGVFGEANNAGLGKNYGIFGRISGNTDGAAIYGTSYNNYGLNVDGFWAGFFHGNVKVSHILETNSLFTDITLYNVGNEVSQASISPLSSNELVSTADKISQLSTVQYYLNSSPDSLSITNSNETLNTLSETSVHALENVHYGLAFDELKEMFPNLVYEDSKGKKAINYIEMIPLLVESIKELKAEIAELQGGNNGGVVLMSRSLDNANSMEENSLTIPVLEQNNPNPFTENTVIGYTLPESVQTATLYIYDMNGTQVHQMTLTERGSSSVTVSGGELSAGMYLYSLIADGKVIDTKRMILTK